MKQTWLRRSCRVLHRLEMNCPVTAAIGNWCQTDWVDRCRVVRAGERLFWGWIPALEGF